MLIKELPALAGGADSVVWAGGGNQDELLRALLPMRPETPRRAADEPFDPDALMIAFVGPDQPPDGWSAALRGLPAGGRLLLLLGWPVADLPYHLVLDPLVGAGCQVLQAVPVDKANRHGVYCAVIAARVERLAPLRSYLDDSPITLDGPEPGLPALLRLTGEHTFADLVVRPLRRRLAELEAGDRPASAG
ncbi:hypothetical protein [Actinoplanes siamensis]|uniref:Uncharacterized protein n=1 Tax=Actinoplanes siamensis TaxID=1223317 RepID=A0A919N8G5_9ACTN|nr:hypothetical protein [Actinoplanes siamensis]GIF06418.1 hypothetical protein Asi03nite_39560 [Actinoplanes siamensis]